LIFVLHNAEKAVKTVFFKAKAACLATGDLAAGGSVARSPVLRVVPRAVFGAVTAPGLGTFPAAFSEQVARRGLGKIAKACA
jgi:hypothetical protein